MYFSSTTGSLPGQNIHFKPGKHRNACLTWQLMQQRYVLMIIISLHIGHSAARTPLPINHKHDFEMGKPRQPVALLSHADLIGFWAWFLTRQFDKVQTFCKAFWKRFWALSDLGQVVKSLLCMCCAGCDEGHHATPICKSHSSCGGLSSWRAACGAACCSKMPPCLPIPGLYYQRQIIPHCHATLQGESHGQDSQGARWATPDKLTNLKRTVA